MPLTNVHTVPPGDVVAVTCALLVEADEIAALRTACSRWTKSELGSASSVGLLLEKQWAEMAKL